MKAKQGQKQVRFAKTNTLLAPPADLPMARTSSASSIGPFTPPMYLTPSGAPPPPMVVPPPRTTIRVHPVLEVTSSGPLLLCDLIDPPSGRNLTLRSREIVRSLTLALDEPATNPPVQFMAITCQHLPWTIRVTSSRGFVTVNDVLVHLYHSLRKPIIPTEYTLLNKERDKARAAEAYRNRYRRMRDDRDYEAERAGGMRRIDFLMDRSRYGGLARGPNAYGEEGWILYVMK